ncbi:MAG TPA: TonB-dependent receptor [Rhizomicrobium sp.]
MNLRTALACSTAIIVSFAANPSWAATATATDQSNQIETVIVTGVRASLKSAIDTKKNADQIGDSVVAEDIGKLPDNNVIEALQHVTGVQVSRNAAEANQLLIRGLPDIATLLNGREIFTSTGRFITLQDIPAELLARVDVEKSSRADDLEGGIAGLIDVRLHRPFDFDGLEVAGGIQGTHSSLSNKFDPSGSILLSNRWNTSIGEVGLLVDVSVKQDHYKEEILDNYISSQAIGPVPGSTGVGGVAFLPLTEGAQSIPGNRQRAAADVSLQWRPNDHVEAYAEVFYTRYRNPNSNDFFVGLPWLCANPATATVFPGTSEVKTVNGGCYDLTSNQSFVPKTDTYQAASGVSWTQDNLTLSSEVDYTDSKFSQTGYILDTEYYPPGPPAVGSGPGLPGYYADFNYHNTGTPFMSVTGVDLTDPSQFHMRQFYDQWTRQSGNEFDWRGDAAFTMDEGSFFHSFNLGVRYANRYAQNRADNAGGLDCRGFADPSSPQFAAVAAAIASHACFTALNNPTLPGTAWHLTSGRQFDGKFGIVNWVDADPNWLNNNIGFLRTDFGQSPTGAPPPADPTQSFDDREVSYAVFGKANFGFQLGSLPVDGNFGLRIVDTDADMKGNTLIVTNTGAGFTFTYSPTESKKSSLDWLPSMNLRLELRDDLFLRLAASRTVTRPTFAQLNPGLSLSASTATLLGSGASGNPNLGPEKSDNGDVSLEYYFGPSNVVSLAAFYRSVDGYIGSTITPEVIGGITYQVSQPINSPAGHIDGAEFGYTQFFDFLPGFWSGFGAQVNATYVEGAFQNISKWSYNLVGIYERGPISFRAAYNWRGGFNVGPAPGGGMQPGTIFAKSQPWLDLSASYKYTDNITFTLDATNLLDSKYQDYFTNPTVDPRDTRIFDQTIALGVRFRL